jgi:sugar-specific transcriptional regulator TrmB
MLEEGEFQTLTELGLTGRQARIFLDLLKYETSTVRSIAIVSKLARQDTYKVLDELQELGLVQRQINIPTKFAAISMHDALSILLNRKVKQTSDLEIKTRTIINSVKSQHVRTAEDEKPKLFLIPEGEIFVLKLRKAIESTQKSIDIVSSSKNLSQAMFFLIEELEIAIERGVKIRCIADATKGEDSRLEILRAPINNPSFKIRTIHNHPRTRFCIYDNKEMSVILSSKKDFAKSSLLWLNCISIVESYQDYYEMLWLKAACNTNGKRRLIPN